MALRATQADEGALEGGLEPARGFSLARKAPSPSVFKGANGAVQILSRVS